MSSQNLKHKELVEPDQSSRAWVTADCAPNGVRPRIF